MSLKLLPPKPATDAPPDRSLWFIAGVGLFGMALSFNASTLDPFIYNEKVRLLVSDGIRNTTLGVITIVALLVALVVQPVVGQISDRTRSRWGRRAPFLTIGAVGLALGLTLIVWADSLWLLLLGAMLASCFANTTQAPWQALTPDYIPLRQHGKAAGFKTVMELVGVVAGVAVAGYFLSRGLLWPTPLLTVLLFGLILLATLWLLHRNPPRVLPELSAAGDGLGGASPKVFIEAIKDAPPAFLWWMLNRLLFWAAAISIRTYLLNYLEDVWGFTPAEAQVWSSQLLIGLGVGVFLLALPAGIIADRVGRRPTLAAAGLMAAAGTAGFLLWRDLTVIYVAGGLIASGVGIFASASWSLATNLSPGNRGALYLALANGATIVGSISGRLGGPLIDGVNLLLQSSTAGYLLNFWLAALFFFLSSLVVLKIPETVQT